MPRPCMRSKKLRRACGGGPRAARTRHTGRGLVPRRDAGGAKEQAHLSLGQEGFTPSCRPRSKDPIDLPVRCGLPRTRSRRRPVLPACNTEAMQLHLDEIAAKITPGAHAILLLDQAGWHGAKALKVPSNISLLQLPPRAPELNGQENIWQFMRQNWLPNFQILRRHRRSLLLRLEHAHRSAVENHVHRAARLGSRRSLKLRIGISRFWG